MSAQVLQGLKKPTDCLAFAHRCTPENPLGAPMVSYRGCLCRVLPVSKTHSRKWRSAKWREKTIADMSCPALVHSKDTILLGHGSGGKLSADLVRDIFLPAFNNPTLSRLDDQAIVNLNGARIAITTDSFVVKPLFFPGGDIGSLAVHGTVNDLAMGGAQPLFLSVGFHHRRRFLDGRAASNC